VSYLIAPSILAADFARLGEEVETVIEAGADVIHFDVMDSHYVPNLTIGPPVLEALINRLPSLSVDVHLMVQHESDTLVRNFISAGCSYISIHPESTTVPFEILETIRKADVKAGIVLNPDEPISNVDPFIDYIDYLLIMSVFPGRGGQKFIPETVPRLREARNLLDSKSTQIRLEVDGGISAQNIGLVAEAGADMFVAGTAIFGTPDYSQTIQHLRSQLGCAT